MNYSDWLGTVPKVLTDDSLWKVETPRHGLGEAVAGHRQQLLTQLVRLLLTMVPDQRGHVLHDIALAYRAEGPPGEHPNLLTTIPFH